MTGWGILNRYREIFLAGGVGTLMKRTALYTKL